MKITINGKPHSLKQSCNLDKLINVLALEGKFAVELNRNIVPRSAFARTELCAGDKVEIVHAIGGG